MRQKIVWNLESSEHGQCCQTTAADPFVSGNNNQIPECRDQSAESGDILRATEIIDNSE